MSLLESMNAYYDQGQYAEAIELAEAGDDMLSPDVLARLAWCYYKTKQYDEALRHAEQSSTEKALDCLGTILAYVADKADDEKLLSLWTHHSTKGLANAIVIRARMSGNTIPAAHVHDAYCRSDLDDPTEIDAHLVNNYGRWCVDVDTDPLAGIGAFTCATALYEKLGASYNHIGAAWHHASVAAEINLQSRALAIQFQERSHAAWLEAVDQAPTNAQFQAMRDAAYRRGQLLSRS